jgi:hypothetical protein
MGWLKAKEKKRAETRFCPFLSLELLILREAAFVWNFSDCLLLDFQL